MTIRELLTVLSGLNPDAVVLMSSDGEGNSIKRVDEVDTVADGHDSPVVIWPIDGDVEVGDYMEDGDE